MSLLIAFAGQGSQYGNMFHLLKTDDFGQEWMQQASEFLKVDLFDNYVIEKACADSIQLQCLLVILSVGEFYVLEKKVALNPAFLIGYSLGEVSAFCVSANLNLQEIIALVSKRATFMQLAANNLTEKSGLAVLKGRINSPLLAALLQTHHCHLAIKNADDHYIVGGLLTPLNALLNDASAKGVIKAERLQVNLPSHTSLLNQATGNFFTYLQQYNNYTLRYPLLNALTQELLFDSEKVISILANELSYPLHWDELMHVASEYGVCSMLEFGPGSALTTMIQSNVTQLRAYPVDGFSSFAGLIKFMANNNFSA